MQTVLITQKKFAIYADLLKQMGKNSKETPKNPQKWQSPSPCLGFQALTKDISLFF